MTDEDRAAEVPSFVIPTRPQAVPPGLLELPGGELVRYSQAPNPGAYLSSAFGTADEVVRVVGDIMARQADGKFYVFEAAQVLADANGLSARALLRDMLRAFKAGRLRVRSLATGLPVDQRGPIGDYAMPGDIDVWLDAEGAGFRFPSSPAVAAPEPVASAPTSSASPAHSDDLILELRKHREAIERAAHEADQRHTHEQAHAGFARIRAATEAGIKAIHATQKPNASPAPAVAAPAAVGNPAEAVLVDREDDATTAINSLPKSQWKVPRSNRWTKAAKDQMHAMRASYSDAQIAQTFGLKHPRQVGNLIGSRVENAASKESSKSHRRLY